LLQDHVLARADFLTLLGITGATLDWRIKNRELCLAFGCENNPFHNRYLPLDAYAVLMASIISSHLGGRGEVVRGAAVRVSAAVVRESWCRWLKMLQETEDDPDHATRIRPPEEQLFIAVGLVADAPLKIAGGTMLACMQQLGPCDIIRAVPIAGVLRQLRTNSRINKIDLPDRLTVSARNPKHEQWQQEIEAYRKLAAARQKAKTRTKKAKTRKDHPPLLNKGADVARTAKLAAAGKDPS